MSNQQSNTNKVGIIGGSGFYKLLSDVTYHEVITEYGKPSDVLMEGTFEGKTVVFLPRHGRKHTIPPHKIPYRANILALKQMGVKKIIAPSAVGSLQHEIAPGNFVVCNDYIDRTRRPIESTFFNGPEVRHIHSVGPYCEGLRKQAIGVCEEVGVKVFGKGTIVVIDGPRFSTSAESELFSDYADVIGMTSYPEVVLVNEMGMCYVNISLVTDYDARFHNDPKVKSSSAQEIMQTFKSNLENIKKVIFEMIRVINLDDCPRCKQKVEESKFS